ncbi:MAG TPA: hypothetical protein PLU75_07855 [Oscillospiraceae bacterium]|nr:hypothetical protein [Oscillospiraceae bacterium]HQQ90209.1 hypothetical protein [Oscillospiraceae bacterium]HRW56156.1 hypothetical protein [Oscillospiraceae bacterium]
MPDLSEQLSAILSNPEAQKNIQSLLASFGGGNAEPNAPPREAPSGNSFGGGLFGGNLFGGSDGPGLDMDALMKIQKMLSSMNQDDKDINLLRALRPHLKEPGRVDEAIRILQLISVLPALGESGLFGGGRH